MTTETRTGDTAELTAEQRFGFALQKLEHETRAMRKAQSMYHAHGRTTDLSEARLAEKRVDDVLDVLHAMRNPQVLTQPTLNFDD